MTTMSGGCLCGAVRYELSAPALFGGFCHCVDCRKTSSSHSASMAVPEAALKVTGETRGYSSTGGSGNPVIARVLSKLRDGHFFEGRAPGRGDAQSRHARRSGKLHADGDGVRKPRAELGQAARRHPGVPANAAGGVIDRLGLA